MWRYLNEHSNVTDNGLFLSFESRLAILLRASKTSIINSKISTISQFDHIMFARPNKYEILVEDSQASFDFIKQIFISNIMTKHSSELLILTYARTWTTSLTSPLNNDLRFFSLLYARFGTSKIYQQFYKTYLNTNFSNLQPTHRRTASVFWYQRAYIRYDFPQQYLFILQLHFMTHIQEIWHSPKTPKFDTTKWQNVSWLQSVPGAFSEYLYIETH